MEKFDSIEQMIVEIEMLKEKGETTKVVSLLESNIINYNDDYRFFEELGDIYLAEWLNYKAKKAIDFALKLNPESATWNYLKWFLCLSTEDILGAIKYLEESNKQLANNSEVLRNLWFAYTISGQFDKWIYILKRAQYISPDDNLIKEDLAMALIDSGEILEWTAMLKQVNK
jgi:tetratricopeptide (TPR) repeat protein